MGEARYKIKESFPGIVCHVYNRGVNKEKIFRDDEDYIFYLKRVRKYKEKFNISIICYSLIANHYHYILEQLSEYPITKFMRAVHTSYGQYYNKKYNRVGPLFQDRFKQAMLDDNNFLYISAYINANAQIHKLINKAEDYKWCSYQDYLEIRSGTLCDKLRILSQFNNIEEYKKFTEENANEFIVKKELSEDILEN
ncbi:MAG: transposase [Candidatus Moraniibacteriota bacterium]